MTMMMTVMMIAVSMSRITFAFPPQRLLLVTSQSNSIYSSIRRPLTTSISSVSALLLFQQRGGDTYSNSDHSYTSAKSFIQNTVPGTSTSSSSRSFLSSSKSKVIRQMSVATTEVRVDDGTTLSSTTSNMNHDSKLTSLRALMKERNIDIYLIPSDDPHLSGKGHFVTLISFSCVGMIWA
jgi:hypothetical protein